MEGEGEGEVPPIIGGEETLPPFGEGEEGEEEGEEEIEGEGEGEGEKPPGEVEGAPPGEEVPEEELVEEHPPDTVSYLTCQVYASWLDEFGSNIEKYSKCLRKFREMVEGRFPTRHRRIIFDINPFFLNSLVKSMHQPDIITQILRNWGTYLKDSSEFERNMAVYFKGKPVTKCAKCGDYTLNNLPADHEIPPELKVAVDSNVRWKSLLAEAEKLCEQYSGQAEDTISWASHETIDITDATLQSSDTSMYVFEDFTSTPGNGRGRRGSKRF